jgi:UDP-glucuronate decarboxylase
MIEGLIRMINAPNDIIGPINLGNPRENSVKELAERVTSITGSRSRIQYMPLPSNDPKQRRPDIAMARKLLNWGPTIALEQGLARAVAYSGEQLGVRA